MPKRRWYHYLIALALLVAGWEALALLLDMAAFPRIIPALRSFWAGITEGWLVEHFGASFYRVTMATIISLVVGVPLGLYLGRYGGPVGRVLVSILHPIPKVVFLPVIIVGLGIGDKAKIFQIALVILFQIVVTVMDAASAVSQGYIRSVRSLGGGEWAIFRHVMVPATLPGIFTALRLSTGTAIAVLFLTETVATTRGLGAALWDAWSMRAFDMMFAGVLAMGLMGFGFYVLLDWAERLVCPWVEARK